MSSHTVRVNNFVKLNEKLPLDWLSKVFIFIQSIFGLNRIGVLTKKTIFTVLSATYIIFFISCEAVFVYNDPINHTYFIYYVKVMKFVQFLVCAVLCYTSQNKIRQFYEELAKFDTEIKCKPKVNRTSIIILLSMIILSIISTTRLLFDLETIVFVPLHLVQTLENHYYAFLFNLLNQRLQIINGRIEASLLNCPNSGDMALVNSMNLDSNGKKVDISMNKLMDLYYIIINAYDKLTDGIKWQLLFLMTTSFTVTLLISYNSTLEILSGEHESWKNYIIATGRLVMIASEAISLIAPCTCCDKIRGEVRTVRELLATKLFENTLDKENRSVARALLALTNARNLSFSLLRMVDISISLPFSFLSLTATYLIIMLQFEKVINPTGTSDNSTV